jgi:hypothetical protein
MANKGIVLYKKDFKECAHSIHRGKETCMHIYAQIYDFAASAGALEGYVYHKKEVDMTALPNWVDNLSAAYQCLPSEVLGEFQPSIDFTIGRAIRSLIPVLGEGHEIIGKLQSMVAGNLPRSADDFQKKKWFEET